MTVQRTEGICKFCGRWLFLGARHADNCSRPKPTLEQLLGSVVEESR